MEKLESIADIKSKILADAEKAERALKRRALVMALVEGVLLVAYLAIMNFHDRLHWLILVASLLVYGTLTAGLATFMARIDLNTQRVLKAILMERADDSKIANQ